MKKRNLLYFHISRWIIVKILLTAGLVAFCLGVWPGYLIHTYQTVGAYPGDVQQTAWLSINDVVQQHFSPASQWLSRLRLAVAFDKSAVTDECLIFTLWDENGKNLCSREIYLNQIDDSSYFDISINKKLKSGQQYIWSITLAEPTNLQYALLSTGSAGQNSYENISLLINGENTQKNALSQYEYYAHYDKAQIVGGFWIGALMVWLILLEVTDHAERLCKRKE